MRLTTKYKDSNDHSGKKSKSLKGNKGQKAIIMSSRIRKVRGKEGRRGDGRSDIYSNVLKHIRMER